MNTSNSVAYGWVAFTAAFLTGAYIGKERFDQEAEKRYEAQEAVIEQVSWW